MRQPYLSVFEKGFFFEDEEAELAAFTGTGACLLEGAVRGLLAAAAALLRVTRDPASPEGPDTCRRESAVMN